MGLVPFGYTKSKNLQFPTTGNNITFLLYVNAPPLTFDYHKFMIIVNLENIYIEILFNSNSSALSWSYQEGKNSLTILDRSSIMSTIKLEGRMMNRLSTKQRAQIVAALVEGNSIRATCRMTGAAKGTVLKLLADLGKACAEYQDRAFNNLKCKRIQCDEIWSFCYAKESNLPKDCQGQFGL